MHSVREILEAKNRPAVVCVDPLQSVYEAIQLMDEKHVGAVLVMVDGYLMGILSERDFVRRSIVDHKMSKQIKVCEAMTHDPVTVNEQDSFVHCLALMREKHIRHLPVVRQGKAVGMISLRDLFVDALHEPYEEPERRPPQKENATR